MMEYYSFRFVPLINYVFVRAMNSDKYMACYTSSSEDEVQEIKPNKKRKTKNWVIYNKFENAKLAEEFIAEEHKWSFAYSYMTEQGEKRTYRCNRVKARGLQCDAAVSLLYVIESDEVVMFKTKTDHNCDGILTKSTKTLDEDIKGKIKELFNMGLKTKGIIEYFAANNSNTIPTSIQVNNLIKKYRAEKYGTPSISMGELEYWLEHYSLVPEDEIAPFVLNYHINEDENSFRFFITSKVLLENALDCVTIHCDATYKIIWQGFPVLVVGSSDFDRHFHVFGISVSCTEQTEDYEFLFNSLKEGVLKLFQREQNVTFLVSDGAKSIHNAFKNVYGEDSIILMCWAHMRRNIDKKILKLFPKNIRPLILDDLEHLQLANSNDSFDNAVLLFVKKWSAHKEFINYFTNEWIAQNKNWFEGAAVRVPSTNNCLESWNKRLKEDRTYRQRIPLSRFLIHCCEWLKTWSNSYKLGITKVVSEPTITLELWTKSYQWVKSKKK